MIPLRNNLYIDEMWSGWVDENSPSTASFLLAQLVLLYGIDTNNLGVGIRFYFWITNEIGVTLRCPEEYIQPIVIHTRFHSREPFVAYNTYKQEKMDCFSQVHFCFVLAFF